MIVTDENLAEAQSLAYAINALLVGCSPSSICVALGTVLACADVEDAQVREYIAQISVVAAMVRGRDAKAVDEVADNVVHVNFN
tara:strand:+ start:7644 stop:7895 length:252 start_codon:yes stop_codon:yes gene_type:complete